MRKDIVNKILAALGMTEANLTDSTAIDQEAQRVENALMLLRAKAQSRVLYKLYDMDNPDQRAFIENKILIGDSIRRFLGQPKKILVCATTLGNQVDQLIRREGVMSISAMVLIDTAAMEVVEEHLNNWMASIKEEEAFKGYYFSNRFSPGYGDMPLTMQEDILQELQCQKQIGLTVSDSGILLPKKSVTAIIGLYDQPFKSDYSNCDSCLIRTVCKKRERGDYCGY